MTAGRGRSLASAMNALTEASTTDRAALALRAALTNGVGGRRAITCLGTLVEVWATQPRFLLRELAALLDESRRPSLLELWPKVLLLAERQSERRMEAAAAGRKKKRAAPPK